MMDREHNAGLTLVEMLVVLGVIVVLATIGIRITMRVDTQSKENALRETFALLSSALEQFHDYGYTYSPASSYAGFNFPLDCTDFPLLDLQGTLQAALGAASVQITNHVDSAGGEYPAYSGCEAMYFFLSQVPAVAQVLKGVSPALLTNSNGEGLPIAISIDGGPLEAFPRVVDPWGTTLRYEYYDVREADRTPIPATRKTFPVLVSAGPDRKFGTGDDIKSRGR
jgi:prepilin-type N-terminal cleavage/methylation domain-containing protein